MKRKGLETLELGIRIWTSFYVFVYGVAKPFQFEGSKLSHVSLQDATGFEMMWAFFGTTQIYPIIIGCLQMLGAVLLLFNKTKLLAALLLTPIFINIILLDIFYGVPFGALLNAIIYQSVFIFIMIQQREKLFRVFNSLIIRKEHTESLKSKIITLLIALGIAVVLYFGYYFFTLYVIL